MNKSPYLTLNKIKMFNNKKVIVIRILFHLNNKFNKKMLNNKKWIIMKIIISHNNNFKKNNRKTVIIKNQ